MDKTAEQNTAETNVVIHNLNGLLHYWLKMAGVKDNELKADLVYSFTGGRETSSRHMKDAEVMELVKWLKRKYYLEKGAASGIGKGQADDGDKANRMRRKVISIGHEMGWKLPDGKIDMKRVNEFCEKRGHGKKGLNQYTAKELPMLITQFERLLKSHYAKG